MRDPLAAMPEILAIEDPTERAKRLTQVSQDLYALQTEIAQHRAKAVQAMKASGMSWAEIGRELGVHRNRAAHIAEGK